MDKTISKDRDPSLVAGICFLFRMVSTSKVRWNDEDLSSTSLVFAQRDSRSPPPCSHQRQA